MPMPVTGAYRRAHEYIAPWRQRDNILLDEDHHRPGVDDPDDPAWQATAYQETPIGSPYVGDDWVTAVVPGLVLDRTPAGHDPTPNTHRSDYGAGNIRSRGEAALQFSNERYELDRNPGLAAAAPPSDAALRRGLTADAQNNPPSSSYGGGGWRPGWYERFWTARNFKPPARGMVGLGRVVDARRTVTPQLAQTAADAPAPDEPGAYNYTGDLSSMARAIRNLNRTPQMRRTPQPIDDPVMVDERGASPMPDSWVM